MLTPVRDDYNDYQTSARNIIKTVNGVLKINLRCSWKQSMLQYKPKKAATFMLHCCTFHNLSFKNTLPEVASEEDGGD